MYDLMSFYKHNISSYMACLLLQRRRLFAFLLFLTTISRPKALSGYLEPMINGVLSGLILARDGRSTHWWLEEMAFVLVLDDEYEIL